MPRQSIKFTKNCQYCGEEFTPEPHSRKNFKCLRCQKKSYEFGRMKRALASFQRMLLVLADDRNKKWYRKFYAMVDEFREIVKDVAKEIGK